MSVEVYGGDLEAALEQLKRKSEGTMGEYRKHLAFTSPAQQRRQEEYRAAARQKNREQRKLLRQEAARHRKDR